MTKTTNNNKNKNPNTLLKKKGNQDHYSSPFFIHLTHTHLPNPSWNTTSPRKPSFPNSWMRCPSRGFPPPLLFFHHSTCYTESQSQNHVSDSLRSYAVSRSGPLSCSLLHPQFRMLKHKNKYLLNKSYTRTSLMVQWLRIHLPMQGTWV